jgi:hypothetical protein
MAMCMIPQSSPRRQPSFLGKRRTLPFEYEAKEPMRRCVV